MYQLAQLLQITLYKYLTRGKSTIQQNTGKCLLSLQWIASLVQ